MCLSVGGFFVVMFAGVGCVVCSGVLRVWGLL